MTVDKLLSEAASWVDFSDRSTWFCDYELTVPALHPQDVRYVKNKAPGGPITYVNGGLELDSEGRAYFDMEKDDSPPRLYPNLRRAGHMYNMVLSSTYGPEVEKQFMRDAGIWEKKA